MNNNYENSDGAFGAGNGQDELDFPFPLFLYSQAGPDLPQDEQADDLEAPSHLDANPFLTCPKELHGSYSNLSIGQPSYHQATSEDLLPCHHSDLRDLLGHSLSSHSGAPPASSPRIEITCPDLHNHHRDHVHTAPVDISRRLTVPPYQNTNYRESVSPASSNSSTSWHSEAYSPQPSPGISPSGGAGLSAVTVADLCPMLQAIHSSGSPRNSPNTSPRTSITEETFLNCRPSSSRPGSRSSSPQGKRTYEQYQNPNLGSARSRSPSPHTVREEPAEPYCPPANLEELVDSISRSLTKPVPTKIVRPNQEYSIYSQPERAVFSSIQEVKREPIMEPLYVMPPFPWLSNQLPSGMCSVSVTSLPALEWALPSRVDQYVLSIEVQPRQHHRAHYETEGSRGAVKTPSGGHPVVQLHGYNGREALGLQVFIGTSDERAVRPHAFYQVHRITGKTVTTTSHERLINGTKVLELPLEPKDNMRAVVDCAGILKLKNADIELRKGETDVGRKNTRVRLVFRVHVPQPGGQWLSLQVASNPIECSQRSAHESPTVERQDVECCSVPGGLRMILTGQNFTSESRVIFSEKTQDGLEVWEAEATVDREKSQSNMLYVEIPPYRDQNIYHPAKVNFYVQNGKRKRSQPQHFTYMPLSVAMIKAEPVDEYQYGQLGCSLSQVLSITTHSCHHTTQLPTSSCGTAGTASSVPPRVSPTFYPQASEYQLQHPAALYQSQVDVLSSNPGHFQSSLDHSAPRVHAGSQSRANPASHLKPTSYQRTVAGHSYEAAASSFPGLDVSEFVPIVPQQRSFGQRAVPPGQSYRQPQSCPPVEHQRTSNPARVTVKQENLDQAYLDDVNEVIGKDLTVHTSEQ